MKIKRYVAENMRTALNDITEELGQDAVILSSKKLEEGVEVMAAVDVDESVYSAENIKAVKSKDLEKQALYDKVSYANAKKVEWMSDPVIDGMQDRIKNLEGLLKEHLSYQKWKDIEINTPNKAEVIKRLVSKGFEPDFIRESLQNLPDYEYFELAWQEAQNKLVSQLKVESDPIICHPGIYALVGTTGVGKTTTIAKLAARYALRYSPDEVGLITTDIYRIAAKEQLSVYANILNIPVFVAETEQQLKQALHRLRGKKLILIDTAGFSQKDPKFIEQIQFLNSSELAIQFISVLSASMSALIVDEVVTILKRQQIERSIITKIDEANLLGEILSIVIRQKIALSYVSNGQRVPEDIRQVNAVEMIRDACACENSLSIEEQFDKFTSAAGIVTGGRHVKTAI